jgi:hypothetical protein
MNRKVVAQMNRIIRKSPVRYYEKLSSLYRVLFKFKIAKLQLTRLVPVLCNFLQDLLLTFKFKKFIEILLFIYISITC